MIRTILILAAFAGLTSACAERPPEGPNGEPMERLSVVTATGEADFWVEIADDEAERQRGLMYRPPLEADRGMLFEFPDSQERSFWMRDTPSSLDIVFIDKSGRIVSIAPNTTPQSEASVPSYAAAAGVLELRAGRAAEIGAKPGDRVEHEFFE